jgi:hypothetical protein
MRNRRNQNAIILIIAIGFLLVFAGCASDHKTNPGVIVQAPTDLYGVALSSSEIRLIWQDNSDNEQGFEIYRRGLAWTRICSLQANTDLYADFGLIDSAVYSYFVVAVARYGESPSSDTITLYTLSIGQPPDMPDYPIPFNGVEIHQLNVQLEWQCNDPDGDSLIYDLYFGLQPSPPLIAPNLPVAIYDPGTLIASTTYYWQVAARDNHKHKTFGPVWTFITVIP